MSATAFDGDSGWEARLTLGFRAGLRNTVLADRARHGPLSVQRPFYPEGPVCHVYLLHPPGGVVGGDRLLIDVDAAMRAQALVTTPGATKFYRSAGPVAVQEQRLRVGAGACLEWLPQENILFPGADVELSTRVDLEGDARLALWEIHCLGRPVIDESFSTGRFDSRLEVFRRGRPRLLERLRVTGEERLRRALLAGQPVAGTLVLSDAGPAERDAAAALLPQEADGYTGVTLVDDMLVLRYLGRSTERAKQLFSAVWSTLRPGTLGLEPTLPRIWAT